MPDFPPAHSPAHQPMDVRKRRLGPRGGRERAPGVEERGGERGGREGPLMAAAAAAVTIVCWCGCGCCNWGWGGEEGAAAPHVAPVLDGAGGGVDDA